MMGAKRVYECDYCELKDEVGIMSSSSKITNYWIEDVLEKHHYEVYLCVVSCHDFSADELLKLVKDKNLKKHRMVQVNNGS